VLPSCSHPRSESSLSTQLKVPKPLSPITLLPEALVELRREARRRGHSAEALAAIVLEQWAASEKAAREVLPNPIEEWERKHGGAY
jgi:hypothetical protein